MLHNRRVCNRDATGHDEQLIRGTLIKTFAARFMWCFVWLWIPVSHIKGNACLNVSENSMSRKTFWQKREEINRRIEENVIICTLQAIVRTITKAITSKEVTGENLIACAEDVRNACETWVVKCEWWDRRGWEKINATNWLDYDCGLGVRVGVVFKALRYKPAGRGFDSRWCHWNFSVT